MCICACVNEIAYYHTFVSFSCKIHDHEIHDCVTRWSFMNNKLREKKKYIHIYV